MSKCVFCHLTQGHDDTCPRSIPTTWGPGSGPWPVLARTMLDAWKLDSSVYDRGGSKDIETLEDLWDKLERALGTGQAEVAMALMFAYYEGASTEAPSHRGAHSQGPTTEGPA